MTSLNEVPTEELLSFQDYPTTHNASLGTYTGAQLDVGITQQTTNPVMSFDSKAESGRGDDYTHSDDETSTYNEIHIEVRKSTSYIML